jgi:hypothetical protein
MNSPLLDREGIERLFEVQRRAAILLMHEVGPIKQGVSFRVDRAKLAAWVREVAAEGSGELRRRQVQLDELGRGMMEAQALRYTLQVEGRPPVPFPVVAEVLSATFESLPSSIFISPGRICIEFPSSDPQKACGLLYELSKALANDYSSFLRSQSARDN